MATAVKEQTPRNQYTAAGGQTVFDYGFVIFDKTHLVVERTDAATGAVTTLAEGTDYTVSGVGDEDGGDITLTSGATADDVYTLYRQVPLERLFDYQTSGDFRAPTVNEDFDLIWQVLQEVDLAQMRSLRLAPTDQGDGADMVLPSQEDRSQKYLRFDNDGKPTTSDLPSSLSGTDGDFVVENISSLLQLTPDDGQGAFVQGFYERGDGGGGPLYFDANEDQANHNGGTIVDPDHSVTPGNSGWWSSENTGSGCWVSLESRSLLPEMFGAVGDGVADDSLAVEAVFVDGKRQQLPVGLLNSYLMKDGSLSGRVDIGSPIFGNGFGKLILSGQVHFGVYDGFSLRELAIEPDFQDLNANLSSFIFVSQERLHNGKIENVGIRNTGSATDGSERGERVFNIEVEDFDIENVTVDGQVATFRISSESKNISMDGLYFYNMLTPIYLTGTSSSWNEQVSITNAHLVNTSTQQSNYDDITGRNLVLANHTEGILLGNLYAERAAERLVYLNGVHRVTAGDMQAINTEGFKFVGSGEDGTELISDGLNLSGLLHRVDDDTVSSGRSVILYDCRNVHISDVSAYGQQGGGVNFPIQLSRYLNNISVDGVFGKYYQRGIIKILIQDEATLPGTRTTFPIQMFDLDIVGLDCAGIVEADVDYGAVRTDFESTPSSPPINRVSVRDCSVAAQETDFGTGINTSSSLVGLVDVDWIDGLETRNNRAYGVQTVQGFLSIGSNCQNVLAIEPYYVARNPSDLGMTVSGGSVLQFRDELTVGQGGMAYITVRALYGTDVLSNRFAATITANKVLPDDGTYSYNWGTDHMGVGWATAEDGAILQFSAVGTDVTALSNINAGTSNIDGNLSVHESGGSLIIRNRRGSTLNVAFYLDYVRH